MWLPPDAYRLIFDNGSALLMVKIPFEGFGKILMPEPFRCCTPVMISTRMVSESVDREHSSKIALTK
jgi:hypothetical protein